MSEIRYEASDGVAVVTLDAPARRNALTVEMAAELVAALDEADADGKVGAVVIGGGASFCAGADRAVLAAAGADPAEDAHFKSIEAIYQAFLRVGELRSPTIAAIRGAAVGAGMNLALATDLRVVGRDARLLSGFLRIGLHPGGGHFALLARTAGREAAAALGLFGAAITGTRAVELGMAWAAVDDAAVDQTAFDLAAAAAADPELSRRTVASFRRSTGSPGVSWDVGVEVERSPQMWSMRRKAPGARPSPPIG
ncbi:enoyl-CoA hydratase-related protein [Pseudofrankia sp. BMG5.36]|uniref:enoyl-CoA hydratase-related protein n=1 Tax=Pseudofrankia sp. BMG5.36 TaxID=1834512 RepID=UPI0008DAD95A|nr:enoyl-CoA hydratase-related protein [Pseudofrankia sp. BMG5.36]OHV65199.1 enoyl-CoA hydratase [Pseudofrankia sp. BMG5.36]